MALSNNLTDLLKRMTDLVSLLETDEKIDALNEIRWALHMISPFAKEPVDCVQWIRSNEISANDYNPNSVAPPEMKLLQISIAEDGYTQPVVGWLKPGGYEVVDGFHRTRVAKEVQEVSNRLFGRIPLVAINTEQNDRGDRIAATIRHNRARGKHAVSKMADIVLELKRRNWSDAKIGKNLGMDEDEVLRLTQVTGLAEAFKDREFSQAWQADLTVEEFIEDIDGTGGVE